MDKWMVTRFRLIVFCITIIVAFFLTQGALYSREIFQEWMINNTKFYFIDGFAETLTGGKSKEDFYGEASNKSDDEKGGKLWIDEPRETGNESSHISLVKGEITSKNNIIIYFYLSASASKVLIIYFAYINLAFDKNSDMISASDRITRILLALKFSCIYHKFMRSNPTFNKLI